MPPTRLDQLTRLLAADPSDSFVLYGLAQEHAKLNEHARAVHFYDRCLTVDPSYCYAYYHKAISLQSLDLFDEMKSTLEAGVAAARSAGDGKALNEIGGMLATL